MNALVRLLVCVILLAIFVAVLFWCVPESQSDLETKQTVTWIMGCVAALSVVAAAFAERQLLRESGAHGPVASGLMWFVAVTLAVLLEVYIGTKRALDWLRRFTKVVTRPLTRRIAWLVREVDKEK